MHQGEEGRKASGNCPSVTQMFEAFEEAYGESVKRDAKEVVLAQSERKKILQVTLRDQQKITIADDDRDLLVAESGGMIVIYRKSDESATKQVAYIAKDQVLCIVRGSVAAKPTEDSPA